MEFLIEFLGGFPIDISRFFYGILHGILKCFLITVSQKVKKSNKKPIKNSTKNSIKNSIEKAIGSSKLTPTNSELINSKDFKLSCVAKKDIPKGKLIKESDIAFSRPGGNLSPKMIDFILDKRINKNIEKGKPFTLSDFNDN